MSTDSMLDQAVVPDQRIWRDELQKVDWALKLAVKDRDDHWITDLMGTQVRTIRIQGVAMSKLLSGWRENAAEFGIEKEDWIDHAKAWTGLAEETIRKYTDLWNHVLAPMENTERFWTLIAKPIQGLLLLTAAVKEDQLSEEDWVEIEDAYDGAGIKKVVRRARGEQTSSKTAIQLVLGRDGVLTAWRADERAAVGYLNPNATEPLIDAAVERILNAAGIRREA